MLVVGTDLAHSPSDSLASSVRRCLCGQSCLMVEQVHIVHHSTGLRLIHKLEWGVCMRERSAVACWLCRSCATGVA